MTIVLIFLSSKSFFYFTNEYIIREDILLEELIPFQEYKYSLFNRKTGVIFSVCADLTHAVKVPAPGLTGGMWHPEGKTVHSLNEAIETIDGKNYLHRIVSVENDNIINSMYSRIHSVFATSIGHLSIPITDFDKSFLPFYSSETSPFFFEVHRYVEYDSQSSTIFKLECTSHPMEPNVLQKILDLVQHE